MHALKRIMTSSLRPRRKCERKRAGCQTSGTSASPESFPGPVQQPNQSAAATAALALAFPPSHIHARLSAA
ncbi:hypothetical protein KC368_g32 [Hortaea werneckii]|nr:hypothetical protein KC368_g32 [Hortaea werneckii]